MIAMIGMQVWKNDKILFLSIAATENLISDFSDLHVSEYILFDNADTSLKNEMD